MFNISLQDFGKIQWFCVYLEKTDIGCQTEGTEDRTEHKEQKK